MLLGIRGSDDVGSPDQQGGASWEVVRNADSWASQTSRVRHSGAGPSNLSQCLPGDPEAHQHLRTTAFDILGGLALRTGENLGSQPSPQMAQDQKVVKKGRQAAQTLRPGVGGPGFPPGSPTWDKLRHLTYPIHLLNKANHSCSLQDCTGNEISSWI